MSTSSDLRGPVAPAAAPLDLWHLADGATCIAGAQRIFNVVGHVTPTDRLWYRLNGGRERLVAVEPDRSIPRLQAPGHFNIDTITTRHLRRENHLELMVLGGGHRQHRTDVRFSTTPPPVLAPGYRLDVRPPARVASVVQVVDGHWSIETDSAGTCLAVTAESTGYDRVALLGTLGEGPVAIEMQVTVDRWTSASHGVGFVFGWQGHPSGLGADLPQSWTTGLAYYTSKSQGLQIRLGRDVRNVAKGARAGAVVLDEHPLDTLRHRMHGVARRLDLRPDTWSQWRPGRPYTCRLEIVDQRVAFGVWPTGGTRRRRSLRAILPGAATRGAVGILLHHAAARIHDVRAVAP